MRETAEAFVDAARDWCEGRSPWARLALWAYLAYTGLRHLADPLHRSLFSGITLAFHEMGHILFSPFGHTLYFLGGSITQVAVPVAAAVYLLLRQGDFFGLAVGMSWTAFSLWELAAYVYDAPRNELALVGFSGQPEHDWGTLLTKWQLLNQSDGIAFAIRGLATLTWLVSIGGGAVLCWWMIRDARSEGA